MHKRFIIFILLIVFVISTITLFSVLTYVDPYEKTLLAVLSLITSFLLCSSSFGAMVIYFFKKMYYRGNIYVYHIFTSLRQAFLWGILMVAYFVFRFLEIPAFLPALLLFCVFVFLELFLQNLEQNP